MIDSTDDFADIITAINSALEMLKSKAPSSQRNRALGWLETAAFTLAKSATPDGPVGAIQPPNLNKGTIERLNLQRKGCRGCSRRD